MPFGTSHCQCEFSGRSRQQRRLGAFDLGLRCGAGDENRTRALSSGSREHLRAARALTWANGLGAAPSASAAFTVVPRCCQWLPVRCKALGRSAVSVWRVRDQGGRLRRGPRATSVREFVKLRHHPPPNDSRREVLDRACITSCGSCVHASSVRPGHVSSSHPDGGSNVTCPSASCSDSDLRPPSANRTSPASTHPRFLPLPLVRFASRQPACGT